MTRTSSFQINASKATANTMVVSAHSASYATLPARTLPSPRLGSQAYFWTLEWQQGERLADFDYLSANTYEPADVNDLVRWFNED